MLMLDAQGHSTAVFVFRIGSTLTTARGSSVVMHQQWLKDETASDPGFPIWS